VKCPKCNHENPPETTYCGKCATPLRPNVTETLQTPVHELTTSSTLAGEHPDDIDYQGCLGALAARRGDRDEALRISGELAAIDRRFLFGSHTFWRSRITALLGEKEQAVALLKEAFSQGLSYGVFLHRDINLEPLWDYPPFKELLRPKG
jgi:zinc-ribbon domain